MASYFWNLFAASPANFVNPTDWNVLAGNAIGPNGTQPGAGDTVFVGSALGYPVDLSITSGVTLGGLLAGSAFGAASGPVFDINGPTASLTVADAFYDNAPSFNVSFPTAGLPPQFEGKTVTFTTGDEAFNLSNGATLAIAPSEGNANTANTVITFKDGSSNTFIDEDTSARYQAANNHGSAFSEIINGFSGSDKIVLQGLSSAFLGTPPTLTYSNGLLAVSYALYNFSFKVPGLPNVAQFTLVPTASGEVAIELACFGEGTIITTPGGATAVQHLCAGDLVATVGDGKRGGRPVIWIGHRRVDCARHPNPQAVWPVRVSAGAFGEATPARDLFLSPDHAVLVDGALIPVRCLVNGSTVVQVRRDAVTYWHVELEEHVVLLAEGLPCESYLDSGNRGAFAGGRATALHPDFSARSWDASGCAPLVVVGPLVEAARRRLADRAAASRTKVNRRQDPTQRAACA